MFQYFIFLLLCAKFLYARECSDCVVLTSCPIAMEQAARHENRDTFTKAFCGFDFLNSKRPVVKVCCSDFARIETRFMKDCDDCMVYSSCPRALESFKQGKDEDLFQSAFCGYDESKPTPVSKVCCSEFRGPIETHPNIGQLPVAECGGINGKRIVGGTIAALYEFPWMALIAHSTKLGVEFKCGGSIINTKYILTAAHCVEGKLIAGVRVGEHDIRRNVDCQGSGMEYICESHLQDLPVEESIVHEDFSTYPDVKHDIALLRVKGTIDFTHQNVAPVCLPATDEMRNIFLDNRTATVSGWGLTERGRESSILRKVDIPMVPRSECYRKYNSVSSGITKNIDANQICAGEPKRDSCNGDSGGPLMLENVYQGAFRIVQYGVVSHGPKKCGSDTPGVYTDVSKYMEWILNNIRK